MAAGELTEQQLENRRKAFDFADAWARLISTLATGTLVLSATFLKDVFPKDQPFEYKAILFASWAALAVSTMLGPMVLGALIAHLNRPDSTRTFDVFSGSIRLVSLLQIVTFFVGITLFAIFVGYNL
jgi:MFS family permease